MIFKQKKLRQDWTFAQSRLSLYCSHDNIYFHVFIDNSMRRVAIAQSARIPSESSRKTRSLHFGSCKYVWSAMPAVKALKILHICAVLTEPLLLDYPFMKLLASSREDPTLLHANNTDADQSAHLRSPISAPVVRFPESIWSSSRQNPSSGLPFKRTSNQFPQLPRLVRKFRS